MAFDFKTTPFSLRSRQSSGTSGFGSTITHKVDHNSGLERAKQKVERSGPAPIVAQLQQTVNTVSYHFNHVKTDAKISNACSPILCMEINDRTRTRN